MRLSPQFEIVPWGSVSNMHTRSPSSMAATAKPMASVDFPVPPFWLAKVIVHTAFAFVAAAQNSQRIIRYYNKPTSRVLTKSRAAMHSMFAAQVECGFSRR